MAHCPRTYNTRVAPGTLLLLLTCRVELEKPGLYQHHQLDGWMIKRNSKVAVRPSTAEWMYFLLFSYKMLIYLRL